VIERYRRAIRYAACLDYENRKDLVHDTYINWLEKKGRDLFQEHEGTVVKAVYYMHMRGKLRLSHSFMKHGVRYTRQKLEFSDHKTKTNNESPEDTLIMKDFISNIEKSIPESHKEVFKLISLGFTTKDISETTGRSQQFIDEKKKRIRVKVNKLINERI